MKRHQHTPHSTTEKDKIAKQDLLNQHKVGAHEPRIIRAEAELLGIQKQVRGHISSSDVRPDSTLGTW